MNIHHRDLITRTATEAAKTLSDLTEWAPAGIMLRVARLAREGEAREVILSFAQNALAECLNTDGKMVCAGLISMIDYEPQEPQHEAPEEVMA